MSKKDNDNNEKANNKQIAENEKKEADVVETDDDDNNLILNSLSIVTDNLETYQGRDTIITLMHYLALIMADLCAYFSWGAEKNLSENFVNMFVQLSNCRVMLRLLDDCGAIREYYRFHKLQQKKKTINSYLRWLTIVNLLFWVLYNPFEHLGWLAELKIIDANDQLWYFYTNCAWAGGLFTSVLLNLRVVYLYYLQKDTKSKREDEKDYDSSEIISHSEMNQALLIAFRDFLDWCIAIHFMPEGFLWSAKLYHYQVGLIGTVSSLCRVHTYVINRQ